ncbi:IS66 family insertion sequence element accessory protein TnpB [Methylobacterium sp. J-078]|uniref:IS66 family insertion sequence element accessory protein TnpB n=1 Tax=Methylobacterium sp. J-078 TaxID=2836657 RepID=UPI00391CF4F7
MSPSHRLPKGTVQTPLTTKRLETRMFCWPKIADGVVRLTAAQLAALLEGLDWERVHAARTVIAPALAG